jgi:hypothetical protein
VDERVRVQHLERGAQFVDGVGKLLVDHAPGLATQDGTQAFATCEDAVAHGFMYGSRVLRLGRDQTLQRAIGRYPTLFQSVSEHGV